jgi:solute carrier family 25 (mitochondrial aspartate/glutamate transporter), member 12/13
MGHKLSEAVIERLPTLCTLTPGGRISFSEVNAFHNVIRGTSDLLSVLAFS